MTRQILLRSAVLLLSALGPAACGQQEAPPIKPASAPVAQTPPTPQASPEDLQFAKRLSNAFKSVAGHAEPSVVNITQLNRVMYRQSFFEPGQMKVLPTGLGSGFVVSKDGFIVTNNHVVANAQALKVKFTDGQEYDAKLVGRDEATDLAVIRVDTREIKTSLVPLNFGDSDSLDVGEWVVAIGSPFGLSSTVTAGIVSAKGRSISPKEGGRAYEDFIQTDAAINPGNSGGPLLNLQGEVIGINSAIASRTGGYEGIGFAIPSNIARAVMDNIIAHGKVVRGWMGVDLEDAKPEELSGSQRFSGVIVKRVLENSPAEAAGIKEGDIITKFAGKAVTEPRLRTAIAITSPGTQVPVEFVRAGTARETTVTLGDQNTALGNVSIPQLGMTVRTITGEMARAAGVPRLRGVIVAEIDQNGRAATSGFKVGDILVAVDDGSGRSVQLGSADDLSAVAAKTDFSRGLRFNAIRDNMQGYLDIHD
jgi:serine protease Do